MKRYSKKSARRRGFIYFRYIFPIVAWLLGAGLLFIPAYRFITAETGINSPISIGEFMRNSWNAVRLYLFGGGDGERVVATEYFAKYLFAVIIVFTALFLIGAASRVFTAISAARFFRDGCRDSKRRAVFLTLCPNRAAVCIYHALSLPIFTFGLLTPLMYRELLNIYVEVTYNGFDMLWAALALYASEVVVILLSARYERLEGMDIFFRRAARDTAREAEPSEEEATDAYSELERRAREEQAERIRELLDRQRQDKE